MADILLPDDGDGPGVVKLPDEASPMEGSYKSVFDAEPDQAAKVVDLVERTGQPASFVEKNLKKVDAAWNAPVSNYFRAFDKAAPETATFLKDPSMMAVSKDDLDPMQEYERSVKHYSFGESMGRSLASGVANLGAGVARIPALAVDIGNLKRNVIAKAAGLPQWSAPEGLVNNPVAMALEKAALEINAQNADIQTDNLEAFKRGDYKQGARGLAAQFVANSPTQAAIVAATLSGYGIPALVGAGVIEAAQTGAASRKAGADAASSTLNAILHGAAESGFETLGTYGILKQWEGRLARSFGKKVTREIYKDLAKTLLTSIVGEANEEYVTSVTQDFSDYMTGVNPRALDGIFQRAANAGLVGAVSGGALTAGGAVFGGALQNRLQQKQSAEKAKDMFLAMGEQTKESKLYARLPAAHAKLVTQVTKNGPVENVHISAEAVEKYFQSVGLDPLKEMADLGAADAYADARDRGASFPIPLARFNSLIEDGHYEKLADDIKFSEDQLSVNETKERVEEAQAEVAEAVAEAKPLVEADAAMQVGHDAVALDIKTKLLARGRPAGIGEANWAQVIEDTSRIEAAIAVVDAKKRGVSVEQAYAALKDIRIVGSEAGTGPSAGEAQPPSGPSVGEIARQSGFQLPETQKTRRAFSAEQLQRRHQSPYIDSVLPQPEGVKTYVGQEAVTEARGWASFHPELRQAMMVEVPTFTEMDFMRGRDYWYGAVKRVEREAISQLERVDKIDATKFNKKQAGRWRDSLIRAARRYWLATGDQTLKGTVLAKIDELDALTKQPLYPKLSGDVKEEKGPEGEGGAPVVQGGPPEGPGVGGREGGAARQGAGEDPLRAQANAPLTGAPTKDFPGPSPEIRLASYLYEQFNGLPVRQQAEYAKVDPQRGKMIAGAFDAMIHAPNDPLVQAAYRALITETLAQYQVMKQMGLTIEPIPKGASSPYASGSAAMIKDVRSGHLWFFSTEEGFGPDARFNDHPLFAYTDEYLPSGMRLRANDIFRVVHDFFGHAKEGNGFGPRGEENAWQSHMRMYSDIAARAMTSETRGQNSWVNYGPFGETNQSDPANTKYADQKAGLLPDWVMTEGMVPDVRPEGRLQQGELVVPGPIVPTFYSKLALDITQKMGPTATAEQVNALLRDAKEDERRWSEIDKFIEGKTKIAKDALLEFLGWNQLQVQEKLFGPPIGEQVQAVTAEPQITDMTDEEIAEQLEEEIQERADEIARDEMDVYISDNPDQWKVEADERQEDWGDISVDDVEAADKEGKWIVHLSNANSMTVDAADEDAARDEVEKLINDEDVRIERGVFYRLTLGGEDYSGTRWDARQSKRVPTETFFTDVDEANSAAEAASDRELENVQEGLWDSWDSTSSRRAATEEIVEDVREGRRDLEGVRVQRQDKTFHASYTLEGPKTNYREMLFSIPANRFAEGQAYFIPSAHFGGKAPENTIAHTRFDDRVDADGKTVLFIEEIQSDLHQAGREGGYKTPEAEAEYNRQFAEFEKANEAWKPRKEAAGKAEGVAYEAELKAYSAAVGRLSRVDKSQLDKIPSEGDDGGADARRRFLSEIDESYRDILRTFREAEAENVTVAGQRPVRPSKTEGRVPDFPFKKNWHEFVMKRMIRFAAEHGYDKIAWTTGQQQADRWGQAMDVDGFFYSPAKKTLRAYRGGRARVEQSGVTPDNLAQYVGRDLAEKLLAAPPAGPQPSVDELTAVDSGVKENGDIVWVVTAPDGRQYRTTAESESVARPLAHDEFFRQAEEGDLAITGVDAKFGGGGMKQFYDKMLVSFGNKFGKKWGAQVGKTRIVVDRSGDGLRVGKLAESGRWAIFGADGYKNSEYATESEAIEALNKQIDSGTGVHSISITPELRRAALTEGFPLYQAEPGQPPRGFFDAGQNLIALLASADETTALHEYSHAWLRNMFLYVKSGQATESYLNEWEKIAKELGVKTDQTKLTDEQQEKWADAWEANFFGGAAAAPVPRLKGVFTRQRKWMTAAYKRAGMDNPNLQVSPEMKAIFDRMLATEEEIAEAQRESGYLPVEIEGLDPVVAAKIKDLQIKARETAEDILLREVLSDFKAEDKNFMARERERLTGVWTNALGREPLYEAQDFLRRAIGIQAGGGDREIQFTAKPVKNAAAKFLGGTLEPEKVAAFEEAAELNGFADGTDLARKLASAKPLETAVSDIVEAQMAKFGTVDRELMREMAREAIYADETSSLELIALEREALADMIQGAEVRVEVARRRRSEAKVTAQAVKEEARATLSALPINQATSWRPYVTAERQAAVKAAKATLAKKFAEAAKFKRQQLVNHALAAEALRNKKEVERMSRNLAKFEKRGRDLLGMPYGFIRQIDGLLGRFGLMTPRAEESGTMEAIAEKMEKDGSPATETANATGLVRDENGKWAVETLEQLVQRVNENYYAMIVPTSVTRAQGKKYSELTMGELRDIAATVKALAEVGKTFNRFLSGFIKVDIKEAARQFRASVEDKIGRPYESRLMIGSQYDSAWKDNAEATLSIPDAVIPSMVNLLTLAHYLDGGEADGPAKRYTYRILKRAEDSKFRRFEKMTKELNAIMERAFTPAELADYPNQRIYFESIGRYLTREQVLGVALNWGNEGNRDRIRAGFGVDDVQIKPIIDALTEKEMNFVQDTFNYLQTFWPDIVAQEMAVRGVQPKSVEPAEIETTFGKFKGGYFPIVYDFERSSDAYKNAEQKNALYKQYSASSAHTDSGHTQERVANVKRPVRLTMTTLFNHLDNVVHDLEFRKAVIDVARFLNQPDVKTAIEGALGPKGLLTFNEALKAVASDQGEFMGFWEKAARWFRFRATFSLLAIRPFTFLIDLSGNVINSIDELGPARMLAAMKDFVMDPAPVVAFVNTKSERMRKRASTKDRDMMDMSKHWAGKDSALLQYGFIVQILADEAVAYPLWSEVYKNALDKHGEETARDIADEVVTRTLGSGSVLDQVGAQRGSEYKKIFTMFFTWSSMMFNRMWLSGKLAGLEYNAGNTGAAVAMLAKAALFMWVLQALNENFWREFFRNAKRDDEKERRKRMIARTLSQPFGYVWIGRDIAGFVVDKAIGKQTNYRFSPMESAMESILTTVARGGARAASKTAGAVGIDLPFGDKPLDRKYLEEGARAGSYMVGIPVSFNNLIFNMLDWIEDNGELTWRDALSRRTKK